MGNSKLLVIQVLIDIVDDIMREESFNALTGLWEDQGQTEKDRKIWHDVFENIVESHNKMLGLYSLASAANYGENYYALKAAVSLMVNDFMEKKGGEK